MNRIEWTVAAIRVLAIWVLIEVVLAAPYSAVAWKTFLDVDDFGSGPLEVGHVALMSFGLPLLGALLFWFLAPLLSRLIWRDQPPAESPSTPITPPQALSVGIVLLGLYLLVSSVPALVQVAFSVSAIRDFGDGVGQRADLWINVVGHLLQLALAVWFIFGGGGLARLLDHFRQLGLHRK